MFNYRLNDSHVKKFSTKAPQYYADGAVYPIGKPTLNEEGYWGESYNFEVSAAYVKTFAEKHTIDAKFVYNVAENTGWNFNAYRGEYLSTVVTSYLPVQQIRSRMAEIRMKEDVWDW